MTALTAFARISEKCDFQENRFMLRVKLHILQVMLNLQRNLKQNKLKLYNAVQ